MTKNAIIIFPVLITIVSAGWAIATWADEEVPPSNGFMPAFRILGPIALMIATIISLAAWLGWSLL
jgi:hypothetical protein